MTAKKQSRVDLLEKKIEILKRAVVDVMNENKHLSTLNIGMLKTIELMPGYQEAIAELKTKMDPNYAEEQAIKDLAEVVSKTI